MAKSFQQDTNWNQICPYNSNPCTDWNIDFFPPSNLLHVTKTRAWARRFGTYLFYLMISYLVFIIFAFTLWKASLNSKLIMSLPILDAARYFDKEESQYLDLAILLVHQDKQMVNTDGSQFNGYGYIGKVFRESKEKVFDFKPIV